MPELRTATFRKQHEDIVNLVKNILGSLDLDSLKTNSHGIRKLLTKLSNNVKVHLILEDSALYPILANSDNKQLKTKSNQFMEEMGVISGAYSDYVEKWSKGSLIKEDTGNFVDETKAVMDALLNRIERENTDLYKILDEL